MQGWGGGGEGIKEYISIVSGQRDMPAEKMHSIPAKVATRIYYHGLKKKKSKILQ